MERWMIVWVMVAAFLAGMSLAFALDAFSEPSCPTADSCSIDYRDGRWHITEETP